MTLRARTEESVVVPADLVIMTELKEDKVVSDKVSEKGPSRKTKYHDIVRPRIKTPHYQHVGLLQYRTDPPEWDDDGITIPQNIGRHVLDEDYHPPRTSPPFKRLHPEDLLFPLTPLQEWARLYQEGIEATDWLLTVGEIRLANDKKCGKWRCKPSPLRNSWTYTEAGNGF